MIRNRSIKGANCQYDSTMVASTVDEERRAGYAAVGRNEFSEREESFCFFNAGGKSARVVFPPRKKMATIHLFQTFS